jgi:hypothetical protein
VKSKRLKHYCFEYVWNGQAFKAPSRSIELDKIEGQSSLTVSFRYEVSLAPLAGLRFLDDAELQQFVDLRADG